ARLGKSRVPPLAAGSGRRSAHPPARGFPCRRARRRSRGRGPGRHRRGRSPRRARGRARARSASPAIGALAKMSEAVPLRVLLLAGEPSGDRHGARVAQALKARGPCDLFGLAGPEMRAAGVRALVPMEEVSVLGFVEVLAHLPALWRARRRLEAALASGVDLVMPIDFPGFNIPFAERARKQGAPVLYYVSPQVWAWGKGRVPKLA